MGKWAEARRSSEVALMTTALDEAIYWPEKEDIPFIWCQTHPTKKPWINNWQKLDFSNFDFMDKSYAEKCNYGNLNINGVAIILGQTIHKDVYTFALDFDGLDAVIAWFGSWENVLKVAQQTRIEWHGDKGHIHVLFKSRIPLGDGKNHRINDIGTGHIEVRVEKALLFSWPSLHPDGRQFEPLGTSEIRELKPGEMSTLWDKITKLSQEHFSDIDRSNFYEELEKKIMTTGDGRHFGLKDLGIWYYTRYKGEWLDLTDDQRYQDLCKWNEKQTPPKPIAELDDMWNWVVRTHKEWRDKRHEEAREKRAKFENSEPQKNKKKAVDALEEVMALYHFSTFEETDEILYWDHGVYLHGGEVVVRRTIESMFGEEANINLCREVLDHVRRRTYHKRSEFDADLSIINLKNGLYNIETEDFRSHDKQIKYLSLNQKPTIYDPLVGRYPNKFIKYLNEVVYPSDIWTVIELMAYTFYRDNPFEIITILLGGGSNGKSVLFGVLTALHGAANVSNVSLKTIIERPFALYDLVGKDCNLDAEMSSGVIQDTAILKKITGRQLIRVEQKREKAFDARIYAKEWISCNTLPQVSTDDQNDAYYRRNVIVGFPNKFEEVEDLAQGIFKLDPDQIAKLTTPEELSAIFNLLMYALRGVLKNKRISINEKTVQERRNKYEMAANPIAVFLRVAVDPESKETDATTKETAYLAYQKFCNHYKLAVISKTMFGKRVKQYIRDEKETVEGKTTRVWKGMKLTEDYLTVVPEQETLDSGEIWGV